MSQHKEGTTKLGVQSEVVYRFLAARNWHVECDVATQGGLVRENGTNRVVGWIKPPFWRGELNNPRITLKDMLQVFDCDNPSHREGMIGTELELNVGDPTGAMARVYYEGSPVFADIAAHNHASKNGGAMHFVAETDTSLFTHKSEFEVGVSAELAEQTAEINVPPESDPWQRTKKLTLALRTFSNILEKHGMHIHPTATIGQRPLTIDDFNKHPYVQRIARLFMGDDRVEHFVGTSVQTHTEMHGLENGLAAINDCQMVTPILYAASLAGPFLSGQVNVDRAAVYANIAQKNGDPFRNATVDQLSKGVSHSHRYEARMLGSPSGGAMRDPMPETEFEFWQLAEKQLQEGTIPSVARTGGEHGYHHTDFRIRPDLSPHGTIEIACMDTFGGNIVKIDAISEVTQKLLWKLQMYSKFGRRDELRTKYPALFGQKPSREAYEIVHQNSLTVAGDGTNAVITGMDGKQYPVRELWKQLAAFVQEPLILPENETPEGEMYEYNGLPFGVVNEIDKSFRDPSTFYERYRDEWGYTSVRGFYETGYGTLSDWMLQRAQELMNVGVDEQQAVLNCYADLGAEYRVYVQNFYPAVVENVHQNPALDPKKRALNPITGKRASFKERWSNRGLFTKNGVPKEISLQQRMVVFLEAIQAPVCTAWDTLTLADAMGLSGYQDSQNSMRSLVAAVPPEQTITSSYAGGTRSIEITRKRVNVKYTQDHSSNSVELVGYPDWATVSLKGMGNVRCQEAILGLVKKYGEDGPYWHFYLNVCDPPFLLDQTTGSMVDRSQNRSIFFDMQGRRLSTEPQEQRGIGGL